MSASLFLVLAAAEEHLETSYSVKKRFGELSKKGIPCPGCRGRRLGLSSAVVVWSNLILVSAVL